MIKTWISVLSMSLLSSLLSLAQTKVVEFAPLADQVAVASQKSTGVLVNDDGVIATVALKGFNPVAASVKNAEGEAVKLKLINYDPVSRITLLQLPETERKGMTKFTKYTNSEILAPGSELKSGNELCRLVSYVRRHNGRVLPLTFMRLNHSGKTLLPGSPLLSAKGELVGLIFQPSGDGVSYYALPVDALTHIQALKVTDSKYRPCWVGVSMDHLSDAPVIIGVRPSTPACVAGMKKGDVLLTIGGKAVGSYAEVVNAFYYLQAGKPTNFKVIRGTEVKNFTVAPEVNPLYK